MKVIGKIAGGIKCAHTKVEVDSLVVSVKADAGKRFGADNNRVARRSSAGNDGWMSGDGKRGWKEGMEACGVAQRDAPRGILALLGAGLGVPPT